MNYNKMQYIIYYGSTDWRFDSIKTLLKTAKEFPWDGIIVHRKIGDTIKLFRCVKHTGPKTSYTLSPFIS